MRDGALVGVVIGVVVSIVLLAFDGDEGDISSARSGGPSLVSRQLLCSTGLLLIVSRRWRRFGVGFLAGAIVGIPVVAVLYVILLALTWSE